MLKCKAQGLCYYYNEKFIPGHRCTQCRFLLLLVDDDELPNSTEEPLILNDPIFTPQDDVQNSYSSNAINF